MKTEAYASKPGERIPNNRLPLLVYRNAIPGGGVDEMTEVFRSNGWSNNWQVKGLFTYGHFHSTTHECLGCASGWLDLKVSVGPDGWTKIRVTAGDVVIMPAGVSHQDIAHSDDNIICGGYPDGRSWDNMRQDFLTHEQFLQACKRVLSLPIPDRDPIGGEMIQHWFD